MFWFNTPKINRIGLLLILSLTKEIRFGWKLVVILKLSKHEVQLDLTKTNFESSCLVGLALRLDHKPYQHHLDEPYWITCDSVMNLGIPKPNNCWYEIQNASVEIN